MTVGLVIAIAPNEAMSHGEISKVAKLKLASTNLPLLMVGLMSPPGIGVDEGFALGRIRDKPVGRARIAESAVCNGGVNVRRLFLDFPRSSSADECVLGYDSCPDSEEAERDLLLC